MTQHQETDLFSTLLTLENEQEFQIFFRDLCTPQEIKALQERWRVCQLLDHGDLSYRDIHERTGASLTTIGRVARFLKEESYQGYRIALDRKRGNK